MAVIRILWTAIALILFTFSNGAFAQKVALVIANSDYEHTSQLANPSRDAGLISEALREAGFETVELSENLTHAEFLTQLRAFQNLADGADAALIYYAGHGIESDGRNWLVPTDATLEQQRNMPFEAVELRLLLDTIYDAKLRVVILDACRNNPFANRWEGDSRNISRGLAPLEVDDMLVIYAAAPGDFAFDGAGGNSPFALALARRIVQPGLPVQMLGGMVRDDVLSATNGDQRPFISASMTGRPLFLVDGPDTQMEWLTSLYSDDEDSLSPPSELVDYSGSLDGMQDSRELASQNPVWLDEHLWLEAVKADNVAAYRAYLEHFPEGAFARFAEANVAQLLDPTATGGEVDSEKPWIISLGAALPDRYAIDLGARMPMHGVWRISTNDRRLRIERGRAFAVDGWNHALLFRVEPEQVTMVDVRREDPGVFLSRDILLNGDARMTLRADGNLDVTVGTFPFPVSFVLIREALDDPAALAREMPE